MRVLIVEDEERIAHQVADALNAHGFSSDICLNLADGLALATDETFDALIADRVLPDGDAIELVRRLRSIAHDIPILMLTAKDGVEDRVAGLDAGADDYLVKPFEMKELIARMRALLRRPGSIFGETETVGNLRYDFQTRQADVSGRPFNLSRHALVVLDQLMFAADRVVSKELLLDKVYGLEAPESNTIPVHIHNLRRRLSEEEAGATIQTFRGLGYMLTAMRAQE